MKFNNRRFYSRLNIFLFSGLLIVLGVRFFFGEHKKFSEDEKRDLAVMPSFTWNTFFDGKYIDSIDDYIADHFPYRDEFLKTSFTMRDSRGIKDNGISYYRKPVVRKEPQNKVDVKKSMTADTAAAADTTAEEPDGAEEEDNLLLYNGHAMEIFGGNDKMAKAYADVINSYQDALKGKVKIYDVVVPSSIEFNCPPGYKTNEKRNIGAIYNNLAPGVTGVDAYSAIAPHRNEYIYFRTDHHWTGLGAYYAYTATARDMGFTPLELDQLDKRYIPNFLGSLYLETRDTRLKDNADTVFYFKIPNQHKDYMYTKASGLKARGGSLYAEGARGVNAYGVFIGGDQPLVRIDSDVKNGRRLVIVKNSYGNPFSTYFPAHFEQVFIVDYRYYRYNILDLIQKNNITDLVFLTGVFAANTSSHLADMKRLMRNPSGAPEPEKDKSKPGDSIMEKPVDSLKKKSSGKI